MGTSDHWEDVMAGQAGHSVGLGEQGEPQFTGQLRARGCAAVLCTGQVCGSFISLTDKPAEAPGGRGWHEVRQLLCG